MSRSPEETPGRVGSIACTEALQSAAALYRNNYRFFSRRGRWDDALDNFIWWEDATLRLRETA